MAAVDASREASVATVAPLSERHVEVSASATETPRSSSPQPSFQAQSAMMTTASLASSEQEHTHIDRQAAHDRNQEEAPQDGRSNGGGVNALRDLSAARLAFNSGDRAASAAAHSRAAIAYALQRERTLRSARSSQESSSPSNASASTDASAGAVRRRRTAAPIDEDDARTASLQGEMASSVPVGATRRSATGSGAGSLVAAASAALSGADDDAGRVNPSEPGHVGCVSLFDHPVWTVLVV